MIDHGLNVGGAIPARAALTFEIGNLSTADDSLETAAPDPRMALNEFGL